MYPIIKSDRTPLIDEKTYATMYQDSKKRHLINKNGRNFNIKNTFIDRDYKLQII
jgi:hypothetical protein